MDFIRCSTIAAAVVLGACSSNGPCGPETDVAFCTRLGRNCDAVTAFDNCNTLRTVPSCGECQSPQTCGGAGTQNVCGSIVVSPDAGPPVEWASLSVSLLASCGGPDPMLGVTSLRYRIVNAVRCGLDGSGTGTCLGPNGAGCQSDVDCGWGAVVVEKVTGVPATAQLFDHLAKDVPVTVQVTAFTKAPTDAQTKIVSFADSLAVIPLVVPPGPKQVQVRLRPIEVFSPVCNSAGVPTVLSVPRAGHTATLLGDGRVLLAGGFDTTGVSVANVKNSGYWSYTATADILDPLTGVVTVATPMAYAGASTPRAFHAAIKLANDQVLISGGEYSSPASHIVATQAKTILLDLSGGSIGGDWYTNPAQVKVSRHTVAAEQSGLILLYGGIYWDGISATPTYVNHFEWFDPSVNSFVNEDASLWGAANTALGHASVPVFEGKYIMVAGGSTQDGTTNIGKLNHDGGIKIFTLAGGKIVQYASGVSLPTASQFVAVGGAGSRYLIIGGFTDLDPSNYWNLFPTTPSASTSVVILQTVTTVAGPSLDVPRGNICAVSLNDGRVLVTGGRGGHAAIGSLATVGVFTDSGNTNPALAFAYALGQPLTDARYLHTCTLLADGSVLVAGGVQENGASLSTLSSMEIFVPKPVD